MGGGGGQVKFCHTEGGVQKLSTLKKKGGGAAKRFFLS